VDADLSLEVTAPSLGGGRREKIQEEGSDMDLKIVYWLLDGESEEMEFGHNPKRECMAYQL